MLWLKVIQIKSNFLSKVLLKLSLNIINFKLSLMALSLKLKNYLLKNGAIRDLIKSSVKS